MNDRGRQFVDTNVLVYAHNPADGLKYESAQKLIRSLWAAKEGCVSTQVLQEFYVTVTRKVKEPLPSELAYSIVAELGAWQVHCPGIADVLDAITLHQRFGISYWDALILQSASELGCEIVWSEDLNPGQRYGGVTVRNPFVEQRQP